VGSPREVDTPTPVAKSRRGGRGTGTRGGRTRHRAVRARSSAHRGSAGACRGGAWECCGGGDRRHSSIRRTLEEEEARLLHLEVSSRSSGRFGFEGLELSLLLSCSQGGADRPHTCACQSTQVGCVCTHEVTLVKGAMGCRERSDDGRAIAQHGHGRGAAARGNGRGGGHDYDDDHANGSASACPRRQWSGGCSEDPRRR
jgi:hypothetical protein